MCPNIMLSQKQCKLFKGNSKYYCKSQCKINRLLKLSATADTATPTCIKSLEAIKRIYASKKVFSQRMTTLIQVGTPQLGC